MMRFEKRYFMMINIGKNDDWEVAVVHDVVVAGVVTVSDIAGGGGYCRWWRMLPVTADIAGDGGYCR